LETAVLVVFLSTVVAEHFGLVLEPQSKIGSAIYGGSILMAWLFILIVSPFFLRSLRGVALAGWIIAFGIFMFGMFSPAR